MQTNPNQTKSHANQPKPNQRQITPSQTPRNTPPSTQSSAWPRASRAAAGGRRCLIQAEADVDLLAALVVDVQVVDVEVGRKLAARVDTLDRGDPELGRVRCGRRAVAHGARHLCEWTPSSTIGAERPTCAALTDRSPTADRRTKARRRPGLGRNGCTAHTQAWRARVHVHQTWYRKTNDGRSPLTTVSLNAAGSILRESPARSSLAAHHPAGGRSAAADPKGERVLRLA
jgi:hypothetical protein